MTQATTTATLMLFDDADTDDDVVVVGGDVSGSVCFIFATFHFADLMMMMMMMMMIKMMAKTNRFSLFRLYFKISEISGATNAL